VGPGPRPHFNSVPLRHRISTRQTCSPSSSSASSTSPSSPPASPEATVTTITRWAGRSCTSRGSCGRGVRRPRRIVGGSPRTRAPTPTVEDAVGVRLRRRPRRHARRGRVDLRRLPRSSPRGMRPAPSPPPTSPQSPRRTARRHRTRCSRPTGQGHRRGTWWASRCGSPTGRSSCSRPSSASCRWRRRCAHAGGELRSAWPGAVHPRGVRANAASGTAAQHGLVQRSHCGLG
jgi:hypothetical protein